MIRSIMFNVFLWPIFGLYLIALYPFAYFMSPKSTYRFAFKPVTNLLFFGLKLFEKIDYKIKNKEILEEALKKGPVIIGCNHQSVWETFVFSKIFDELSIVIKKELLNIAIAGLYFKRIGSIVVDRDNGVGSIKTLLKKGRESIDRNVSVLIFVNGTRTSDSSDDQYKVGIYAMHERLNVSVVVACVDSGKCWPRKAHTKKPGTIILEFKRVIEPGLNRTDFMKTLSESMTSVEPEGII